MSVLLKATNAVRRAFIGGFRSEMDLSFGEAFPSAMTQFAKEAGMPGDERNVSDACIALIKRSEGCERKLPSGKIAAYPDPATGGDPWTIGYGSTGPDIERYTVWTLSQCEARLIKDIERFANSVREMLGMAPTTQGQFDALVSFAYNLGPESLRHSTLLRVHMNGDYEAAAHEFERWKYANGKVMPGLVRRRAAEAAMYAGAV